MLKPAQRQRIGNFEVVKVTKSLTKGETRQLREQMGLSKDVNRHLLKRAGIMYIIVKDISGLWQVQYMMGSTMYSFIDASYDDDGNITDDKAASLRALFTMIYADCTVLGDAKYMEDKLTAIKAFNERVKAPEEKKEEEKGDE